MLNALLKLFFRKSKPPRTEAICATPLLMSGELKLMDQVSDDTVVIDGASDTKVKNEKQSYLPPPPWINFDSSSRNSK